ncbi:MAG: 50S ribosomal protein L23 [Patescibacteria group bacterium]|nr:50S ribosomal protein L23 [Patescibacteria group bacterium]
MLNSVVKKPVISEKSISAQSSGNKYTFLVSAQATAKQVAMAVTDAFGVEVVKTNVINLPAKIKRFRRIKGIRAGRKHVVVTLKKGQTIPLFEEETK